MRRLAVGVAMTALALVGAFVWGSEPAHAHAILLSTSPFDGEILEEPPSRITLEFNEPVTSPLGGVRVFDQRGRRVDAGDAGRGNGSHLLEVGIGGRLEPGTYVVTWRAVSADSHPVRGAFLFELSGPHGSRATVDDELISRLVGGVSDRGYEGAAAATRFLQYAGILVAAGGALFLTGVHDGDPHERARYVRLVRVAAIVGAIAILVAIPIQAALVTGLGRTAAVNPRALGEVLRDQLGWGAVVGIIGLGLVVLGLRHRAVIEGNVIAVAGAVVAAASLAFVGHPVAADPVWLVAGADAVHALAAAAWVGGLLLLALTLRSRGLRGDATADSAAGMVRRFSSLAGVSVAALLVAGSVLAWSEVRAFRALTSTDYGLVLLAKVVGVGLILVVAGFNRFRLVPAVARRDATRAWRFLRATVRMELAGVVVVLALTTALVNLVPARTEAGVVGIFSTYVDLGSEAQVNLVVDPNRAGSNEVHLYLIDRTGRPEDLAGDVEIRLSMPAKEIGPITRSPEKAGPGHWILAGPELSIAGEWLIEVVAHTSSFDQERAAIEVVVNP